MKSWDAAVSAAYSHSEESQRNAMPRRPAKCLFLVTTTSRPQRVQSSCAYVTPGPVTIERPLGGLGRKVLTTETRTAAQGNQTMTANLLKAALIAALLSSAAAFADNSVQVTVVNGQQQAKFSVGDSKCTLANDVVVCAPVVLASN